MSLSSRSSPVAPSRSSTGLSLLDRVGFLKVTSKSPRPGGIGKTGSYSNIHDQYPRPSLFSLPAAEGAGVKSRRLSTNAANNFVVDVCELDDEFVSASKIGRRKEVGRGASATVRVMLRKGDRKGDGSTKQYAVKEFRKRSTREDEEEYVKKVQSEFAIAKSLDHPNIVETVRLCTHNGRWNHVMEYCLHGELFALVDRKYFKNEDKQCLFKQVLRGVGYLHDHGIAHRDIKLENLLMTEHGYIKITDFGVSEVFCGDHPGIYSSKGQCGQNMRQIRKSAPGICGSKPYISPEVLDKRGEYDPSKLDVWSCGILYLTLYYGGSPWQSASKSEINYAIFLEGWTAFLDRFTDSVIDENTHPQCGPCFSKLPTDSQRRCILKMLHPDPDKRCTIQDALDDRWVRKIECCSLDTACTNGAPLASIDVTSKGSAKLAAKMVVQARHDHLPPPVKRMPQHKFDMGDGTSRYD